MTERTSRALRQTPDLFQVGPSALAWDGRDLVIDIDEISTPHLQRLRGRVRLSPQGVTDVELPLHPNHVWRPFAPVARIAVDLDRPGWRWQGHGYLDGNFGTAALEADFSAWTWARMPRGADTLAFYDAARRDGGTLSAAFAFAPGGTVRPIVAPPVRPMARSLWGVRRTMRADPGTWPRQTMAMLDAPFYARAAVTATLDGTRSTGVHEALDLDRFASPLLKPMLALRVPRLRGR